MPVININNDDIRLNSSSSDKVVVNGNLGIGTTSPTQKLTVSGSTGDILGITNGTTTGYGFVDNNGFGLFTSSAGGGTGIYYRTANIIDHYVNGSIAMRLNSTGNVGIGTTSPSEKLHVVGTTRSTTFLSTNATSSTGLSITAATASGGGSVIRLTKDAADRQIYQTFEADQLYLGVPASNTTIGEVGTKGSVDLRFTTAYSERMRITAAGDVGIGTTSPSTKLHVFTTSNSDQELLRLTVAPANSSGAKPKAILGFYTPAEANTQDYTSGRITSKFDIAGYANSRVTIESLDSGGNFIETLTAKNGNVGIGTTSPAFKLDVAGTFQSQGNATFNGSNVYINSDNTVVGNNTTDVVGISGNTMYFPGNGNVGIGTTSPGYKLQVNADGAGLYVNAAAVAPFTQNIAVFRYGGNGNSVNIENQGGKAAIQARLDNGTAMDLSINAAGGNVGIGTTSPAQKLHVVGNGLYTGNLDVGHSVSTGDAAINLGTGRTGNGFAYIDLIGDTTYTDYGLRILRNNGGANTTSLIVHRGTGDFSIQNNEAANLIFLTAATERMRITSAGNVGIGTTNPSYKLDVSGSARVNSTSNLAMFVKTNSAFGAAISYEDSTTGGNDVISAGAIGGDFYISTNYSERVRVTSAGNVGIGTTSPTEKLHVDGSVVVTYNNSYQSTNSTGNKAILARVSPTSGIVNYAEYATVTNLNGFVIGSNDAQVKGVYASDKLEFITNTATRMAITSGGNVGIGTASPTNILHITGVMRMDNVSANDPTLTNNATPKHGYGDVANEIYLAEPAAWFKINVEGTDYIIPAYLESV